MSAVTEPGDLDPAETREWLESIDSVLREEGPERAHFLIDRMVEHARRSGAYLPYSANTAYVNTIAVGKQPQYPGNRELERRIEAWIRWNAMAMVVAANRKSTEYGGHIASYASSATLYEVGFNHFWRAPSATHPGDLVFMQGHSSPGIYARAYLEGRLSEQQLHLFRQEVDGGGLSSYPHPWLMPDFWQFPTVSMGLGPMMAIYQARFTRYLEHRGLVPVTDRKVWAFLRRRRDGRARIHGRADDAGARAARQSGVRHQLQPAAARRAGARQRQDHPGTRGGIPRRRLECDQGHLGVALGSAAGARQRRPAAPGHGTVRRRRIPELQGQGRRLHARALLRQEPAAQGDGCQHVRRGHLAAQSRRSRCAQGLRGLRLRDAVAGPADGDPRQDGEGLRARQGRRGPDGRTPAEEARRRGAAGAARSLQHTGER